MIVVLFGLLGLAIDSGRAYLDRRHLQAAADAAALAAAYTYMNTSDYAQAEQKAVDTYAGDEGGRRLIHAARCLEPRQTEGMTARLRATGARVRLIWGADDAYLPVETVARPLAAALGAPLALVPGGHFLPLDNPAGVARELLEGTA